MSRLYTMVLLSLASACANAQLLPSGWRLPTDAELSDEARSASPSKFARTVGDFNGDGVDDQAFLLKSEIESGEALWVWMSSVRKGRHWIRLDQTSWPQHYLNVPLMMGIDTQPPGELVYACHDADKACNFVTYERRPKMALRYPAIHYFRMESAASVYYWSNRQQKFKHVWLND